MSPPCLLHPPVLPLKLSPYTPSFTHTRHPTAMPLTAPHRLLFPPSLHIQGLPAFQTRRGAHQNVSLMAVGGNNPLLPSFPTQGAPPLCSLPCFILRYAITAPRSSSVLAQLSKPGEGANEEEGIMVVPVSLTGSHRRTPLPPCHSAWRPHSLTPM